uniref:uncharacterized protein LOC120961479 n=1 Tax=Anopheles coluzzii TaxID=1518534 RepID=UPI0020FF83BD|nr:uncharacterized protein LOC120961479 [Anopheles coluzzii]
MELASKLFTELTIQSYHEQALSLTPRLAIETLELQSAPALKHLTILPNHHLRSLYIVNSAVRRIPDTIVNLRNLQFLGIEKSFLRLLDLSVLCYLPRLTTLQVLRNHISLLLPVHESSCANSLRDLHLDYNQLTTLDIAVLAPFTAMQRLLLQHNRMYSLFASQPTSFPLLQELQLGPGNNFTWIEFEQLDLPETLTANLPGNQFQQLPTIRNANLPNLQRIYLDGNQLSTIDLAQLQEHQQLNGIDFSRNRLHTVTASELIHLPNLTSIELVDNMLESFSLVNCSFPQLNYLYLKGNRLQLVPAEVYMSELSPTFILNVEKNPLRSCLMLQWNAMVSTADADDVPSLRQLSTLRGTDQKISEHLQDQLDEKNTTLVVQRLELEATSLDAFIESVSAFISILWFPNFYETSLTIPSVLQAISIMQATRLTSLSVSPNASLQELAVHGCNYRSILRTVGALSQLHTLNVQSCAIVFLNFELFAKTYQLRKVNLAYNQIQMISPPTGKADNLSIEILYLDNNPLQYVDFNSLRQLQRLTTLSIRECNLQRLYSSAPVTLHALGSIEAIQNNLTLFDLLLLDAPSLKTLLLSKNRIHKQPWDLTKYTQLQVLDLDYNRLTTFDLAGLAGLNQLQSLYVSFNQLETFTASRKVRLPSLKTLALISNSLRRLPTYDRWYLPAISFITLVNNLFTAVPLLYSKRWPTVTLRMTNNPLACSSLQQYVEQILYQQKLIVDLVKPA